MNRLRLPLLLAILLLTALPSPAKPKKPAVPAFFSSARYVYVEAMDGDIMSSRLYPEDRQAIADVQDALQRWGRYKVAYQRSEAELIFVVRRGRRAEGRVGASIPGGRGTQFPAQPGSQAPGIGLDAGTEMGTATDMLRVYLSSPDGKKSAQIWSGEADGGLEAPILPLIRQLKAAVEEAYPPQDPSQKKP